MRKLLQSKAAVSVLCVIAVCCVGSTFLDLKRGPQLTAAARGVAGAEAEPERENLSVPPSPPLLARWQDWRETVARPGPRRDPFSFTVAVEEPAPVSRLAVPNHPAFRLQAISIEPGRALAVLNHRVVGVGDALQDYVVEEIHPGEVWMKGELGRIIIPLHPPASGSNKQTSATSRPADLPGGTPAAGVRTSAP